MRKIELKAESCAGARIDSYIASCIEELSRSAVSGLILNKAVTVNGSVVGKSYRLADDDIIAVDIPDAVEYNAVAQDIPLDIIYEDSELLVVNKPKGMVVHPAAGNYSDTLVNALLFHCKGCLSGINGVLRPGIVHRIDKNTSGLLVVAKTDGAHRFLSEQIKRHLPQREYEAVVCGIFKDDAGTIDAPVGRHPVKRKQMAVTERNSKQAVTHYRVISRYEKFTHVGIRLETGRTHQIRVHMAYIGKPVYNDDVYGKAQTSDFEGQCLHARSIGFVHPNGQYMQFEAKLPDYFNDVLNKLV